MADRYQGLGRDNRGGCLIAAVIAPVALVFDLGRIIGDPAPGTEDLWSRHIPLLLPTLAVVTLTFFVARALIRWIRPDDR